MDSRMKFRGKRMDNGEWVNGGYCEIPPPPQAFGEAQKPKVYIFAENPNILADWGMPRQMCLIEVDPATVGQCTGLTDHNGKLIFEGDICKDILGWVFEVLWDNENARFIGRHIKTRGDTYICYVGREPAVEIIGNIHDNPELAEVAQ